MDAPHFVFQRRQELGLSQNDLALRLRHRGVNLSRKVISAWERGQREPALSQEDAAALADALGWAVETLLDAMGEHR